MADNFQFNYIADTAASFGRNYITQQAKEVILNRAYQENFASPAAINSANSLEEGNNLTKYSLLNLPVWDIVTLKYEPDNIECTLAIAMITVNQTRNIEKTPIAGADGTVKEFISAGDANISIKAMIIGNGIDYYPKEDVKSIEAILNVKRAITIQSIFLNKYMNINNVVITDHEWSQKEEGMRNVQVLSLDLISDNPDLYKIILKY